MAVPSVWLISVLPAVVTGIATTLLTLIATRANDRRKFRNDALLASIEQRRLIYDDILTAAQKWQVDRRKSESFLPSEMQDRQLDQIIDIVSSRLSSNKLKIPAVTRRQIQQVEYYLLSCGLATKRYLIYTYRSRRSKRSAKYIPYLVSYFFQVHLSAWAVHNSINRLAKYIDRDLGL